MCPPQLNETLAGSELSTISVVRALPRRKDKSTARQVLTLVHRCDGLQFGVTQMCPLTTGPRVQSDGGRSGQLHTPTKPTLQLGLFSGSGTHRSRAQHFIWTGFMEAKFKCSNFNYVDGTIHIMEADTLTAAGRPLRSVPTSNSTFCPALREARSTP